jgi:UDP-glucuronate decarboxylase
VVADDQGPAATSASVPGAPKKFGAESTYDKESNSIQYSTVAHFPPVRLLPNADRKRILGELALLTKDPR